MQEFEAHHRSEHTCVRVNVCVFVWMAMSACVYVYPFMHRDESTHSNIIYNYSEYKCKALWERKQYVPHKTLYIHLSVMFFCDALINNKFLKSVFFPPLTKIGIKYLQQNEKWKLQLHVRYINKHVGKRPASIKTSITPSEEKPISSAHDINRQVAIHRTLISTLISATSCRAMCSPSRL